MGIPGIPRSTGHVLRYDRCKASLVVDKRQRPAPVKDAGFFNLYGIRWPPGRLRIEIYRPRGFMIVRRFVSDLPLQRRANFEGLIVAFLAIDSPNVFPISHLPKRSFSYTVNASYIAACRSIEGKNLSIFQVFI